MTDGPSTPYVPKRGARIRSIIQDGLTSVLYDHHDQESHHSQGWIRRWAQPRTPTMDFKLENEPAYQMALPVEAGAEVVYFIHAPEVRRVKIGYSTDVEKRLIGLQTSSPCALRLIKIIPGGKDLEQRLHYRFRAHHVDGEWFDDVVLDEWARNPE